MNTTRTVVSALSLAVTAACSGATVATPAAPLYSIVDRIPGTGKAWDYAVIDEGAQRLYLAQQGATAVDLNTNKMTTGLVPGKVTHGVAPLGDGRVAVDDSATKTVTIFSGATGEVVATIPTAEHNPVNGNHALDALVLEPRSGLLVAINGESGLLILIDTRQNKVAGTVSIGGKPEFAAADGKGNLYVNLDLGKKTEVVGVDIVARKVVAHFPLSGCEEPTGLAYDKKDDLLISACGGNGAVKFLHRADGREAKSLTVGEGADAVMFDAQRGLAFVPAADNGTLSVIAVRSTADISVVQTLRTQAGTRLGAVALSSGRVYLPAAKFGPPVPPSPYPSVLPGTFEILVAAPK
jgi:DNA-binding beta-propeller fold protein YncE